MQSEEELRVVRFSVPAIFVTLALAIAVVVAEVVRDAWLGNAGTLKPDTAPNFGDQLANNAILVASTAVSAFLVILTYSLFRKTGEALDIAREQSTTAAEQAMSATRQALAAESALSELRNQVAMESTFEARRSNPFLDLDPDDIGFTAGARKVYRLVEEGERRQLEQVDRTQWDAPAEAARHAQHPATYYYALDDFSVRLPIHNKGQGSAIDVSVRVEPIGWANIRPMYARTADSQFFTFEQKVVFDRVGRGEFGMINLTRFASSTFANLVLGPDKTWEIDVVVPMLDALPLAFEHHVVLDEDDVREAAMFNNDLLFGDATGRVVQFNPSTGRAELTDPSTFEPDPEHAERYRATYATQRRLPIGLRVTITYASIDASERGSEPTLPDHICYVVLFRERAEPNEPSRLYWDVELVSLKNKVLKIHRTMTPSDGPAGPLQLASLAAEERAGRNLRRVVHSVGSYTAASEIAALLANQPPAADVRTTWRGLGMSPMLADGLPSEELEAALNELVAALRNVQGDDAV